MKIRVTMKTPDALPNAIARAIEDQPEGVPVVVKGASLEDDDENPRESLELAITLLAEKWFRYSETVTLEIDTEQGTCEVVEI